MTYVNTLKINEQDYNALAELISAHDNDFNRAAYRERRIARADAVKDIDKRYRWDLFWFARRLDPVLTDLIMEHLEETGGNDTHLDSALKRIVQPL